MPTDSIRKQAITALVTTIAGVNGGATYFTNLTGSKQVSSLFHTSEMRQALPFRHWVYVYDGTEEFTTPEVTGDFWQSSMEFDCVLVVKDKTDAPMVEELNDLIHDVMLAVGANDDLGGLVHNLHVSSIDAPVYSIDDGEGVAVMHLDCTYDFQSGVTI